MHKGTLIDQLFAAVERAEKSAEASQSPSDESPASDVEPKTESSGGESQKL